MPCGLLKRACLLFSASPRLFVLLLKDKITMQLHRRVRLPRRAEINDIVVHFPASTDPAIPRMFLRVYERPTSELLRRFLKVGDVFIDVGAHIGYFSALAMGLVGRAGSVHSFEPLAENFARLAELQADNPAYRLEIHQVALGDAPGRVQFSVSSVETWNTLVPGFMRDPDRVVREVAVERLDTYLAERGFPDIGLLKIDAEGYEFPILKGLSGYWEATGYRPPIICEVVPHAYPLLGLTLGDLAGYMRRYGYTPVSIYNARQIVVPAELREITDILFLHLP